jgi:hypothetical protein
MTTPNPYRVAYDAALAEITEITAQFEQLRMRKGQVEHLVTALHAYFGSEASAAEVPTTVPEMHAAEPMDATPQADADAGYSYLDVPNPLPEGDGDPFQRRVKTTFRFKGLATQRSF